MSGGNTKSTIFSFAAAGTNTLETTSNVIFRDWEFALYTSTSTTFTLIIDVQVQDGSGNILARRQSLAFVAGTDHYGSLPCRVVAPTSGLKVVVAVSGGGGNWNLLGSVVYERST